MATLSDFYTQLRSMGPRVAGLALGQGTASGYLAGIGNTAGPEGLYGNDSSYGGNFGANWGLSEVGRSEFANAGGNPNFAGGKLQDPYIEAELRSRFGVGPDQPIWWGAGRDSTGMPLIGDAPPGSFDATQIGRGLLAPRLGTADAGLPRQQTGEPDTTEPPPRLTYPEMPEPSPWPATDTTTTGSTTSSITMPDGIAPWLADVYRELGITPGPRGSGAADWQYWQNEALNNASGDTGYIAGRIRQAAGGGGGSNPTGINGPFGATPFSFDPTQRYNPYPDFRAPQPAFVPTPFSFSFNPAEDPSYEFRRSEALRASDRGAASRGVVNTGGHLMDLQDRAANLASEEYQAAFNRAYSTNQMNNQMGLAANQNAFNQALASGQMNFSQWLQATQAMYQIAAGTNAQNFNQGLQANQNWFNQNYNLATLGYNATNSQVNAAANTRTSY